MAWLKPKLACVWGEEGYNGEPVYKIRKEQFFEAWNRNWAHKPSNTKLKEHVEDQTTIFALANGDLNQDEILVCIDCDVQKRLRKGSGEGAANFIFYLIKRWFPGLYFERSRSGKGINAWFVLQKGGWQPQAVNEKLLEFDAKLKGLAQALRELLEDPDMRSRMGA